MYCYVMSAQNQGNTRVTADVERNTESQGNPQRNRKSGDTMATHAKSDVRYWKAKLFKHGHTRDGVRSYDSFWSIRIAHGGRREQFNLRTANAEAAASKAQRIHQVVVGAGWDTALEDFKPAAAPKPAKPATVGAWSEAVRTTVDFKPTTFTTYLQSLRQIISEIEDVGDQPALDENGNPRRDRKRRPILLSRFDYKTGGRDAWAARVDALPLSVLTAAAVQKWKLDYVARAGNAPDARRRAENSAATLMRCARSLFSEKAREFVGAELILPDPLPLAGVKLPKKGNTAYQSKIDAPTLIAAARAELTGQPFRIFILGLFCGLRKREIDLLEWSQIDFGKGVIRIERTEHFSPKSEDSAGEVDLDAETMGLLRGWHASKTGPFVIESDRVPRHSTSRTNYRCTPAFNALYTWLKSQGVAARKPLHELRKELGAILASTQGIFAAQSVLRHAQISTTAAHYTDKKKRITAGLGSLLQAPGVIQFSQPGEVPEPSKQPQVS